MEQFFRQEREHKLKEFILTSEKAAFTYSAQKHIEYRRIPDEFFDPTATAIYADRILILVWEPLTVVLIKNKPLAEAYKKHFMLLWKIAAKQAPVKIS